eukprot:gene18242-40034_t
MNAIVNTDYEFGFCTSFSPMAPPPASPGFWCDSYNRGAEESRCWTPTQNCCYFNPNATDPDFPGTGQCVNKDPCPEGMKICNAKCYPLRTADGVMTCMRSPASTHSQGDGTPRYSKRACIGLGTVSGADWGTWFDSVCQTVNCDRGIGAASAAAWAPPGFRQGFDVRTDTSDVEFSQGSWVCHQNMLLSGVCDASHCQWMAWPNYTPGPTPPPTPTPPTPKPSPTPCSPAQCYPASSAKGWACQVKASATAISGAGTIGACWDKTRAAADQDLQLFGNYLRIDVAALRERPPPPAAPAGGGAEECA